MALSIGVTRGSRIKIGDALLTVGDIVPGMAVAITIEGDDQPAKYVITDEERTQVLPNVWVQVGLCNTRSGSNSSSLAFTAPRSIAINRVRT